MQLKGQPALVVEALRDARADARKERDHRRALAEELHRELSCHGSQPITP